MPHHHPDNHMNRLHTQPHKYPTAACPPSIRHRTPAAPRRTHDEVTILLPFDERASCVGVETDFIGWNLAVPDLYRMSARKVCMSRTNAINQLRRALPKDWIDVKITRDETEQAFIVPAKRPITHDAPPP